MEVAAPNSPQAFGGLVKPEPGRWSERVRTLGLRVDRMPSAGSMDDNAAMPDDDLDIADVPSPDAPLAELKAFARTFDGYARWGSVQACGEIANARDHSSVERLRTCLFFEVRRWHHFGGTPDAKAQACWRHLVAEIRRRLLARNA